MRSADPTRTPADLLRPMFSRGDLPRAVRLRRAWARWPAGAVFSLCDDARGYLSPDARFVVRADTVRAAADIFDPQPIQAEMMPG